MYCDPLTLNVVSFPDLYYIQYLIAFSIKTVGENLGDLVMCMYHQVESKSQLLRVWFVRLADDWKTETSGEWHNGQKM